MTRKNILLIAIVVLLGGLCFYVYKDRFVAAPIRITHRSMEARGRMLRRAQDWPSDMVVFLLNREIRLTELKVVALRDLQAGTSATPVWQLISDSNSVPVKSFAYGSPVRGMRPTVKGAGPRPLEPGIPYRLFLSAGREKAEHDFTPVPRKS